MQMLYNYYSVKYIHCRWIQDYLTAVSVTFRKLPNGLWGNMDEGLYWVHLSVCYRGRINGALCRKWQNSAIQRGFIFIKNQPASISLGPYAQVRIIDVPMSYCNRPRAPLCLSGVDRAPLSVFTSGCKGQRSSLMNRVSIPHSLLVPGCQSHQIGTVEYWAEG